MLYLFFSAVVRAMEVREATEEDIPEIVDLLKKSLGEGLMPKSEQYWRWKHLENPFGPSPVLLCREGHTLTGIRAFMQWRWSVQGRLFHAVRAVDTATHPEYQGKGIFKRLTLSLVDTCTARGDHFVFNTPNAQSKPGYLKMGWINAGKLPICVQVNRPLRMMMNLIHQSESSASVNSDLSYFLRHGGLNDLISESKTKGHAMTTDISVQYLNWRYINVPVASYLAIGDEDNGGLTGLIIGRIKSTRFGREFRITDVFFKGKTPTKMLLKKFHEWKRKCGVDYCTLSGTIDGLARDIFGSLSLTVPAGPHVTIRSLAMEDLRSLKDFTDWSPSLGDLELF